MSDRSDQDAGVADEELADRPLPASGLTEAMPDWLRRPPAWHGRDLPARGATARPTLPPEDRSIIDPATLVSVDDLPAWLRRLAHEAETPAQTGPDAAIAGRPEPEPAVPERVVQDPVAPEPLVSEPGAREPAVVAPVPAAVPSTTPTRELQVWQQWPVVAFLAAALAIAVVIAVLALAF